MPDVHEVDVVVQKVVPAIGAAVAAYGADVLSQAESSATDATARAGKKALTRLLDRAPNPAPVREAVGELAAAPGDTDAWAALRWLVRKVLTGDAELLTELAAEFAAVPPARAEAAGKQSTAVAGHVHISTSGANSPAAVSIERVTYQGPTMPDRSQG